MTTTVHKHSAQIYEFPVGGRAGLSRRLSSGHYPRADVVPIKAVKIASGSGWYHEAALEAEQPLNK